MDGSSRESYGCRAGDMKRKIGLAWLMPWLTPPVPVNAVAPALIETDMIRDNPRTTPALIPVGRFGTVDEVADVVAMLATNGYITGQTINVNGGWYMS